MNYYEKTIKEERKYTGNVINVDKLTVLLPSGKEATRDIVRHPGASAVVAITEEGKMVMVEQYRKPNDMISLEIPAGKLDENELPEICAKRELKEETGYIAGNVKKAFTVHSSPGFCDEELHIFYATDLIKEKACPDEGEFISTMEYSIPNLLQMITKGEITDAKTIIGIFFADRIRKDEHKLS